MANFNVSTNITSAQTLGISEIGTVTATGALSTSATAVTINDFSLLTIH
jgi:hypothetical protein